MRTSTTPSMLPASFSAPSTLYTGTGADRRRVGNLARLMNSSSMKSPVVPESTMASELTSSSVSVVLRWIGIMIHLGPFSSEFRTSRGRIRFSHLGRRVRRADIAAGGFSVGCASSPLLVSRKGSETSSIASTEKRLLEGNGGARLTRCLTQNPPQGRLDLLPRTSTYHNVS